MNLNYIDLNHVSFEYKRNISVINNISLILEQNEWTAIVGDNGCGKTTLGKLMAGILKPTCGNVWICHKNTKKISLGQIGKKIGYLFQNPERQIFAPTVEEDIAFGMELKGYSKDKIKIEVEKMLNLFQLDHLCNSFPFNLSYGEKQRLALAGILINGPEYLILDEPTTGLDMERKKILSEILKKLKCKGIGMTVISHDEDFVKEHAERIIEISRGEILEDKKNVRS